MKDYINHENQAYWLAKGLEIIDPISNGLIGISSLGLRTPFASFHLCTPLNTFQHCFYI